MRIAINPPAAMPMPCSKRVGSHTSVSSAASRSGHATKIVSPERTIGKT